MTTMTDANDNRTRFEHDPLGPGSKPLVIERLSLEWCDQAGMQRHDLADMIVDMSRETRRRPWKAARRDLGVALLPECGGAPQLVLREERAVVETRFAASILYELGNLVVSVTLPDVCVTGLAGQRLDTLVKLPFDTSAIIDDVTLRSGFVDVRIVQDAMLLRDI